LPAIPEFLGRFTYAEVSVPIAVLIWLMIFPMMMKVDFASIRSIGKNPKGLYVTWVTNWLIKPSRCTRSRRFFSCLSFKSWIPADLGYSYLAGAILLGAAPCTAMVFVWSHLTRGNAAYTVVQVATNDLIILVAFSPIVALLLESRAFPSLGYAVAFGRAVRGYSAGRGAMTRVHVIRRRGMDYFQDAFLPRFKHITIGGLLLTLVIIFSFQVMSSCKIPPHPPDRRPADAPDLPDLFRRLSAAKKLKLHHSIAAPAGMIGASNFFELSVAVAISLFGPTSPVALATIVGVLVEVPVMLTLVKIANRTTHWFTPERS
jgi:ACR3 family arsenite transporter